LASGYAHAMVSAGCAVGLKGPAGSGAQPSTTGQVSGKRGRLASSERLVLLS
jgi:hypothetical protein